MRGGIVRPGGSTWWLMDHAAAATARAGSQHCGAISAGQLQSIANARRQARKISRAAGVAAFNGWTMVLFAAVSIISGLFGLPALVLGVGLSVIAVVELKGSKRLRVFDLAAPRWLALNQIGLAAIVSLYAAWGIAQALIGPGPYDEHIAAGGKLAETLAPIDRLTRLVSVGFYAALIVGSIIAQGCTAVYYLTRRRHVLAFLRSTPEWIIETLRAAAA